MTLNTVSTVYACGPSFVVPVFAFETRPDETLDIYARGNLGIIHPGYNRTFLFAAYRRFNRLNFTASEEKDLVSIWKAELYREDENETRTNEAVNIWLATRKKVLGGEQEPKIYTDRNYDGGYYFFPNCTAAAFETAAETLESRIAEHGASDENVKNWTRGQDAVFTNCSEGKQIPAEVAAPIWLRNDRDYQIAAANFYATNFEEAKTRFERIAAKKDSAWSTTANYLVARTLIRQASTIEDADYNYERLREKRRPFYEQAEAHLQKILADASQKQFHSAAAKLVNLVKYRLRPAERIHELASILSQNTPNENFRQDLIDYRWLMDRYAEAAQSAAEKAEEERAKRENRNVNYDVKPTLDDFPTNFRDDDLTDWIFTFQSTGAAAYKHSLAKWRASNDPAWLVAAISKAEKDSPEVAQLLTIAERVERSAPEFATVAFHRNRLLIDKGLRSDARRNLDVILNDKTLNLPVSARNQFSSQRMFLAQNLDEFLQFAQRRAAAFAFNSEPGIIKNFNKAEDSDSLVAPWQNRTMFDHDAERIFNEQIPFTVLKQAVISPKLPDYLRRNLLIAAWTRAAILGNDVAAVDLAGQLLRVAPEFRPFFNGYLAAKTLSERQNTVTYILLKLPALRPEVESGYGRLNPITEIDNYRDNWWCTPFDYQYDNKGEKVALAQLPSPTFLTEEQIREAKIEREQIKKLGDSSTYLARRAVEFAQRAPADARLPESLHLAVRATRYGCQDCETGKWSKQAHDILKAHFSRSEWAKKTPYWFKDESCESKQQ
ncbi:MAG: hypothetical protein M3209_18405 [Acidobacteriota bacterium]|nr:hypothetical protein [Acidobacteriota bacterium]